jgi:type VI secretion system protein ImpC
MTPAISPRIDLHYRVEVDGASRRIDLPFTTAVLADLSGMPAEPLPPVADRRFVDVDIDGFDRFMRAIAPRLVLTLADTTVAGHDLDVELRFARIDDFAPSAIVRQVAALAAAVGGPARESVGRQIDAIVQNPAFVRLESAWRSLRRLVAANEPDGLCPVRVMSISRADLAKTLKRYKGTAWDQSPIFKKLYTEGLGSPGADPVGCIVADFEFDHGQRDVEMLGELRKIAAACQAPMLAAASPSLLQMDSWQELSKPRDIVKIFQTPEYEAWRALRADEDSAWLVLTVLRYVERSPWRSVPLGEGATYDEGQRDAQPAPLHANAAYLLAAAIQRSFRIEGWFDAIEGLAGGVALGDLPRDAGTGPTEKPIDDRRIAQLTDTGLTALAVHERTGVALFPHLATLAKPADYDDPDAHRNARVGVGLPYRLMVGRVAHFLCQIVRDSAMVGLRADEMQRRLQAWMDDYSEPPVGAPDRGAGARRPFSLAELSVEPSGDESGGFATRVRLLPRRV